MNKSTIEDLCRMGLITKTGLINSKLAEDLQPQELFTKSFITVTGLISDVGVPAPVLEKVDPNDTEAVAEAQSKYEAAVSAYNEAIESSLINVIERRKRFSQMASDEICDWGEMDPNSPAYIKNRTHYKFIDTPKTTTMSIGTPDSHISQLAEPTGESEFVELRMIYANGLSDTINIWTDRTGEESIDAHVSGESLILCEYHFDVKTKSLVSYKYHVVPIFSYSVFLGSVTTAEEFLNEDDWLYVTCVGTDTIKSEVDLDAYIAQELGYEDISVFWNELENNPKSVDMSTIERYVEISRQFVFPKIFGGYLLVNLGGPTWGYLNEYLPAVETNDTPKRDKYKGRSYQTSVSVINPSEDYKQYFGLDGKDSIYLFKSEMSGSNFIKNIVPNASYGTDIMLFPIEDNFYDDATGQLVVPEDFRDKLAGVTLSSVGEETLCIFPTTIDNSELKQFDIRFMPVGVHGEVESWKTFKSVNETSGDNGGGLA